MSTLVMATCSVTLTMLILLFLATVCLGALFDFKIVVDPMDTSPGQEAACTSTHGYDGLAVVSSPEAYVYAFSLVETFWKSEAVDVFVGLKHNFETGRTSWDDDTPPAPDMPWGNPQIAPYGRILYGGGFILGTGDYNKAALCGNQVITDKRQFLAIVPSLQLRSKVSHWLDDWPDELESRRLDKKDKNLPTEAHGITHMEKKTKGNGSILSDGRVQSYLACVLLCGHNQSCRAAEYNLGLSTCTLFGPEDYSDLDIDTSYQTFIRNGYPSN